MDFLQKLNDFKSKIDNLEISVGITTNGYLLSAEKYISLFEYNLTDIQITVDGFSEEHDMKRVMIDGKPSWNIIMSNLDDIVRLDLPVKVIIRTNFETNSIKKEKEFLIYCKHRFKNKFVMHFESIKDWGAECDVEFMNHIEEDEIVLSLIDFCRIHSISTLYDNLINKGFYACQHNM